MKTSEIIAELSRLIEKHGDRPFHICLEHVAPQLENKDRDVLNGDMFFDKELQDICILIR